MTLVDALIALVFGLLFGQSGAAPDGIQSLPNANSGTALCGGTQVTWTSRPSNMPLVQGSAMLRAVLPDGTVIADMNWQLPVGQRLIMRWCGDTLGDGTTALSYDMFSGGAHCCFSSTVLLLEPGARHLLDVSLGNGGMGLPRQLSDADGPLELVGSSDVFAYFDSLPFVASPFMPIVYAYDADQGTYVEATRQFPDYLTAQAADADAALAAAPVAKAPGPLAYEEQESISLRLYGLHVLLGDADTALPRIERRLSPEAAAWLAANAPAAVDAMTAVYND